MDTAVRIANLGGLDAGSTEESAAAPPLAEVLKRILVASGLANAEAFLRGARLAYEAILNAFAEGDLEPVAYLLSPEVQRDFGRAIDERKGRGERVKFMFIGIHAAEIIDAELARGRAEIVVRFVGEVVSAIYDRDGKWIQGHPARVVQVPELWTFGRELRAARPDWLLVATEGDE